MKISIYNNSRTVNIPDRIIEDFEKTIGKKLNSSYIEAILNENFLDKCIDGIPDEYLQKFISKELCIKAYMPYAYITLYDNRLIKVPYVLADYYGRFQGFTPKDVEDLLAMSKYESQTDKMTDTELEDAVASLLTEEVCAGMDLAYINEHLDKFIIKEGESYDML